MRAQARGMCYERKKERKEGYVRLKLAYGRDGLEIEAPDTADVVRPRFVPGVAAETAAIRPL